MPQKRDKKSSKGRLDKYYYLAKEQGYRARSAFKLVQLNKKYGFLEKSKVLIDLCAAPGGWLQVASKYMPQSSLIIGVDLAPIKPIPNIITFQDDITTDKCRQNLRQEMKTWKADVVLHDGAPNVGKAWTHDAYTQSELVLMSLKLATEFLVKGGTFVTKVFRSKDYNNLIWVFQQLFKKVEATKPPSSRNVSAEIFVVCQDYLAPKKLDPRFLDPKSVFAELETEEKSKQADIFHPEKKKRQREGYEDGNYTLHKKADIMEFITAQDPIAVLGSYNQLVFDSDESRKLLKHELTTEDIKVNVDDLKVLGKKDFKALLKWRSSIREEHKMDAKAEKAAAAIETTELEPVDEDEAIEAELSNLTKEEAARVKRARRKANEKRAKTLQRMQLNMVVPSDIGMEQEGPDGHHSLFGLSKINKAGALQEVRKGDMSLLDVDDNLLDDGDYHIEEVAGKSQRDDDDDEEDYVDSDEGDVELEQQLDQMYETYIERQSERDAKYKVKKMRAKENEWKGFDAQQNESDDDMESDEGERRKDKDEDFSDDSDSESEDELPVSTLLKKKSKNPLLVDLSNEDAEMNMVTKTGLTKKAAMFFDQDAFKGIEGIDLGDDDEEEEESEGEDDDAMEEFDDESDADMQTVPSVNGKKRKAAEPLDEDEESDFEIVPGEQDDEDDLSQDELWDGKEDKKSKAVKKAQEIGLITAEAMTLARQLANKEKTKQDLIDEGFTKEAFRDKGELPQWFLDDEDKHNKVNIPVTKEAVKALREKLKALDARPIKKIAEAKARKKFKANQRLEKAKKKATDIADNPDMSEKEKATSIGKLLQRATKAKPKKEVKVVVAKGSNRGVQGRPKGVKGRYKMVDSRMKKEVRALKRIAKKNKKNGGRRK
ncbi:AdoMet-dependent rRNA methyltransferase spb1 [Umbelopsis nana]